jgi:voltage-gated potassium channel
MHCSSRSKSSPLFVFSVEYGLRLWVAVEHPLFRHLPARRARFQYAISAPGIIDLIAVLPFWFAWVLPAELQVLLVFRVIRFLKLGRYSPAIRSLLDALYAERRALIGCFVILVGAALVMATLMYLVEGKAQPDKFGTIPDAMWWAIATLGTIGYGDVVPITPIGRMLATCTIFLGLIMVALPVGIVATAFGNDIHRREFIVTWGMVARVPLFAGLSCSPSGSKPAPSSRAAANPRIRCILWPPVRSKSTFPSVAFAWALGTSSARSRCFVKRTGRPQSER